MRTRTRDLASVDLLDTDEVRALMQATAKRLYRAIGVGLAPRQHASIDYEVDAAVQSALEQNAFIFSGFKTYRMLRELGLSLTGKDGGIVPWETFRESVLQVDATYNRHYLRAEYNHAVAASQHASRWKQAERGGDRYDLQYRTAGDERVREEHAALDGITLPMSDPFWDKYYPPNGWNCRCEAVQVRKGKFPRSDSAAAMSAGDACTDLPKQRLFRYNPGKTLKVFPPQHPYLPKGCGGCSRRTHFNLTRPDRGLPICACCKYIEKECRMMMKEKIDAWRNEIDPKNGLMLQAENLKTGSIRITRGGVRSTFWHTYNMDVLTELLRLEESVKGWTYLGWKKATPITKVDGPEPPKRNTTTPMLLFSYTIN